MFINNELFLIVHSDQLKNVEMYRLNFLRFFKRQMLRDEVARKYVDSMKLITHSSDMFRKSSVVLEANLGSNMDKYIFFHDKKNYTDYIKIDLWKNMCNFVVTFLNKFS